MFRIGNLLGEGALALYSMQIYVRFVEVFFG